MYDGDGLTVRSGGEAVTDSTRTDLCSAAVITGAGAGGLAIACVEASAARYGR